MVFAPAAHVPRVATDLVEPLYRRLRWQVFAGIFIGYAGYYLVRKNFSLAIPYLVEQGYSKGDLGFAMSGVAIAYGLSKFLMGVVSDRSNPRFFLPAGLLLSAGLTLVMGLVPWALSSIAVMFVLQLANGWVQGMGWPPSGRTMVHWWSQKERGTVVSAWNIAHNVGGGLIGPLFLLGMHLFGDWHSAFYVPAAVAIAVALFAAVTMRDTPQSCGLPPVEEWRDDYPPDYDGSHERGLHAPGVSSDRRLLAQPAGQSRHRHGGPRHDRVSDLRSGDADRLACAGVGAKEGRRDGRRVHGAVWLSRRVGVRERAARPHCRSLRLGRRVRAASRSGVRLRGSPGDQHPR